MRGLSVNYLLNPVQCRNDGSTRLRRPDGSYSNGKGGCPSPNQPNYLGPATGANPSEIMMPGFYTLVADPGAVAACQGGSATFTIFQPCDETYYQNKFHACYYSRNAANSTIDNLNWGTLRSQGDDGTVSSPTGAATPISHDWGSGNVAGTGLADNVGGIWRGRINFAAGNYTFHTKNDDGAALDLEGYGRVMNTWFDQGVGNPDNARYTVTLPAGYRNVAYYWYEGGSNAFSQLWWDYTALGTIQGIKAVMPGNQAIEPAASQTVFLDGASPTFANPYFFTNVSATTHTVSVSTPSGYTVGYTLCYNDITCHNNTPTAGSSVVVTVPAGGYADLWWHYTPPFNYSLFPKNGSDGLGNLTVTAGGSNNNAIVVALVSGTTQAVTLSASGLPQGATATFTNNGCNPACDVALIISTTISTVPGTYPITITGTPLSKTTAFTLTVNPPPPTVDILANGSQGPITVDFNASPTLSWTTGGSPTSCTGSGAWSGAKATGGGSQGVGPLTTTPNTYTITCTNAGGSAADSVTVNVSSAPDLTVDTPTATPTTIVAGNSVTFSDIVRNIGGTTTDVGTTTRFTIDTFPLTIYDISTPIIAAGSSRTVSTTPPTPPWIATSGQHTLSVCADITNVVPESNDVNNCSSLVFFVFDPISASCSGSPPNVRPGDIVTWSGFASGGTGMFTYSWTGALTRTITTTASSDSATATYSGTGTQTANLTITSGGSDSTSCSVTVNVPAWLQTTSGDVHSNTGINVPGGQ